MRKLTASFHFIANGIPVALVMALLLVSIPAGSNTEDKKGQILKQKLYLLDNMINKGSPSKKVRSSDNVEAKQLLQRAEELYVLARDNIENGNTAETGKIINEAIRAITSAGAKTKGSVGSNPAERARYRELLDVINSLQESIDLTFENPTDLEQINQMKQQALELSKSDRYAESNKILNSAYQMIATSIADNLRSNTVVYSLDFKDSRDEYEYEQRRYNGNRELVSMMLDQRKESPTRKLIERYTQMADKTLQQAQQHADNNQHDDALKVVEQANKDLSRAMGMLGLQF